MVTLKIKANALLVLPILSSLVVGCGKTGAVKCFDKEPDRQLVLAALRGDAQGMEEVLRAGETCVNCRGTDESTPLLIAVICENKRATTLLLERGADPNLQDRDGYSPIGFASGLKDSWFLETLLKHGADVNLRDRREWATPIFQAVLGLSERNIDILIRAGADINAQDNAGDTPMIRAANINRFDMVYALLIRGADPRIQDNWGYTVCYPIQHSGLDPRGPLAGYRERVIEWLKSRNLWRTENDRRKSKGEARLGS